MSVREGCIDHIVMEYDIGSAKWAKLPKCEVRAFAMTMVNGELVLIGGQKAHYGTFSNKLIEWRQSQNEWTHPYPEMPTALFSCSSFAYNQWLVVAGGIAGDNRHSCELQVLDTKKKQWYTGPPSPIPWSYMKTAVVGNIGYFMGGADCFDYVKKVYSISIETLISQITSEVPNKREAQVWKEEADLELTSSTPVSLGNSLITVGGKKANGEAVTAILLYEPDCREWVKVGDLLSPRYNCTSIIVNRELLVAGGEIAFGKLLNTIDWGLVSSKHYT